MDTLMETDDRREVIKQKLRQYYDGRIVRKDLTKSIREARFFLALKTEKKKLNKKVLTKSVSFSAVLRIEEIFNL